MKQVFWNILKCPFVLSLALGLSSCATEGRYKERVRTWVGENVTKLERCWGEPSKIEKTESGRLFIYDDYKDRECLGVNDTPSGFDPAHATALDATGKETPSLTDPTAPVKPVTTSRYSAYPCLTTFHVSSESKITAVGVGGLGCSL
jgi:hypothetical protein